MPDSDPDLPAVLAAVRAASVAEISWADDRGRLQVRGVVPLASGSEPVLALPYADAELARAAGAAGSVVLTLTEPRSTATTWQALALRCTPRLSEDRDGERFCAELLDQELRKYPPSRTLADSVLLRREQWWWLPRLLVELTVEDARPIEPRSDPADHLLVTRDAVHTVSVDSAELAGPVVTNAPDDLPPGEAVLFGQDVSFPDMEQWAQWGWRGEWDGAEFTATSTPGQTGLPAPPGLLARWRRQRALERACRRGLS